jgi:16S rRNA (adenine1518-N6/adenine1519-N6)-dimethyltransferase
MKIQSKHKWGQNFLSDQSVLKDIIQNVNFKSNDKIIEIGPGQGFLTKELKKLDIELYAFEIDNDMHKYLDNLVDSKTHIIYADFLNVNLKQYFKAEDQLHVIANIPYYITTPIIEKIIKASLNIQDMILMVQKEVADRLTSKPGNKEYGYFTAYLNCYYNVNKIRIVSRKAFNPKPNVDSALIKLLPNNNYLLINNFITFQQLLKAAFAHKRKTLKNNLTSYDELAIGEILKTNGYSLNNRAEDIPLNVWIKVINKITI